MDKRAREERHHEKKLLYLYSKTGLKGKWLKQLLATIQSNLEPQGKKAQPAITSVKQIKHAKSVLFFISVVGFKDKSKTNNPMCIFTLPFTKLCKRANAEK